MAAWPRRTYFDSEIVIARGTEHASRFGYAAHLQDEAGKNVFEAFYPGAKADDELKAIQALNKALDTVLMADLDASMKSEILYQMFFAVRKKYWRFALEDVDVVARKMRSHIALLFDAVKDTADPHIIQERQNVLDYFRNYAAMSTKARTPRRRARSMLHMLRSVDPKLAA